MVKLNSLLILLGIGLSINAQPTGQWLYHNGQNGDYAYAIAPTADGGAIVAGKDSLSNASYGLLIKLNSAGDTMWTRKINVPGHTNGDLNTFTDIEQCTDLGYIVTGYNKYYSAPLWNHLLAVLKFDVNGNLLWSKQMDLFGDNFYGRVTHQTSDGGYVVMGSIHVTAANADDFGIVKLNSLGDTLWTKRITGGGDDDLYDGIETSDGGFVMIGTSNSFPSSGTKALMAVKTDANGNILWSKGYESNASPVFTKGYSVIEYNGDLLLTGTTTFAVASIYLFRVSLSTGALINTTSYWDSNYWGTWYVKAVLHPAGGIALVGYGWKYSPSSRGSFVIRLYDNLVDTGFVNVYGGASPYQLNDICVLNDGYLASGNATLAAGGDYAYLVRTDTNGRTNCHVKNKPVIINSETATELTTMISSWSLYNTTNLNASAWDDGLLVTDLIINPNITATNPTCYGYCDGSASASPVGGISPYSYSWSTGGSGSLLSNLCGGQLPAVYDVTITDNEKCTIVDTVLMVDPAPVTAVPTVVDASCSDTCDGSVTLTANGGTPPYTYIWDPPLSIPVTDSIATGLCANTTYTYNIKDNNGCQINPAPVVSVGGPAPVSVLINGTPPNCNGGSDASAVASGFGGTPGYSYLWDTGDTSSTVTGIGAGVYSITVTDVNLCIGVDSVTIYEPSLLVPNASGTNVTCNGSGNGAASCTPSGGTPGYSYAWNTGATTNFIAPLTPGMYIVSITDANSCVSVDTVIVTEPPQLNTTITSLDASCNGLCDATATVTTTGGTPGYTYLWSDNQTAATATGLCASSTAMNVVVTDANGCTATPSILISEPAVLTVSFSVTDATCNNSDGSVLATGSGGITPYSYGWSNGGTQDNATGLSAGTYMVTVTDSNACQVTDSAVVGTSAIVPQICLVTVDSTSTHNQVVWEKPVTNAIDSFRIYRNIVGSYTWVGSVAYDSLSVFVDTSNGINPNTTSYRYILTTVDGCGNESDTSSHHETIHLTVSLGTGTNMNLIWDNYEGFGFNYYRIWRNINSAGWALMDSVPNTNFTYTDNAPANSTVGYMIEVVPPAACTATRAVGYNSSRSNRGEQITPAGIAAQGTGMQVMVYPNPAHDNLHLELSGITSAVAVIHDLSGRLVAELRLRDGDNTMTTSGFSSGIYDISIFAGGRTLHYKLAIE